MVLKRGRALVSQHASTALSTDASELSRAVHAIGVTTVTALESVSQGVLAVTSASLSYRYPIYSDE